MGFLCATRQLHRILTGVLRPFLELLIVKQHDNLKSSLVLRPVSSVYLVHECPAKVVVKLSGTLPKNQVKGCSFCLGAYTQVDT